jgi:DMSO/TMAO reductase YedYZ molybdopterin-dependent catalytic subunit
MRQHGQVTVQPPTTSPAIERLVAREDAFFAAHGQGGAAAFYAGLLRLGAVLTWAEGAESTAPVAFWANAGARIVLPDATLRALQAALAS